MLIKASEMVVPRLELCWSDVPDKPNEKICWYKLVLPLRDLDARLDYHEGVDKETKTLHIKICHTVDSGRREWSPLDGANVGMITLPLWDKMHAVWDAQVLNLPVYVSYKNQAQLIASPGQIIHSPEIAVGENMGTSEFLFNYTR